MEPLSKFPVNQIMKKDWKLETKKDYPLQLVLDIVKVGKMPDQAERKQLPPLTNVVFQIVLDKSEQSLEYYWMPDISTSRAIAADTSLLHTTTLGPVLHTAHRQHTEGTFLDKLQQEKMNRVPVIGEVELDEDEVDPADITPLVSGDTPIVTVPASEDKNVVEDLGEDVDKDDDMQDILERMEKLDTEVKELWKEIMDLLSSIPEDFSSLQPAVVPQVEVWDTGKAWEQE